MTITEFATLIFKSPPSFSDPTLQSLLQQLSAWQSECSGFPLLFFTNTDDSHQVLLVTGWASVAAHEAWIRGERNQELLRMFGPYVDMPKIRMVHLDVDFETIPEDAEGMVIERFSGERADSSAPSTQSEKTDSLDRSTLLFGRDLARDGGDVFHFVGVARGGECDVGGGVLAPLERWVLKRAETLNYD